MNPQSDRLHVAFFSPAWPPETTSNGIVTYVASMRREMLRLGHRVSIVTPFASGLQPDPCVHLVRDSALRRLTRILDRRSNWVTWARRSVTETFVRLHRSDPIDVVEMEESFGFAASVVEKIPVPVVVKLHGPAFLSLVGTDARGTDVDQRIADEGLAIGAATAVTSPARSTLVETLERYRLEPAIAEHINNPLEIRDDMPAWSVERCDRSTFLFVGRFDERKGGDLVIEAFASAWSRRPDLRLLFVGPDVGLPRPDGARVHIEEYLGRLPPSVRSRITYLGRLPPERIGEVRTKALGTIVFSRWENQSYTAVEAMLQGCPLISCDAGGHREMFEDQTLGLCVPTGDVAALADTMLALVEDVQRAAALGAAANVHAHSAFAPATVADQTLDVYRRCVAQRASQCPSRIA